MEAQVRPSWRPLEECDRKCGKCPQRYHCQDANFDDVNLELPRRNLDPGSPARRQLLEQLQYWPALRVANG